MFSNIKFELPPHSQLDPPPIPLIPNDLRTPKISRFATHSPQTTCALFGKTPGVYPPLPKSELAFGSAGSPRGMKGILPPFFRSEHQGSKRLYGTPINPADSALTNVYENRHVQVEQNLHLRKTWGRKPTNCASLSVVGRFCFSSLVLFSRQQAGSYSRREGSAPQPREACVESAKDRTQINRRSEPVTHCVGMCRSRQIRRKMMNAPGQDRPYAHNREEEDQRERKQHVAQRNHVRRTRRPGTGFHAPHCNQAVT